MSQSELVAEIYGLYCPTTGALRYIGKANCASKRLKSHIRDARRKTTPVCLWIRELLSGGLTPRIEVLVRSENWIADERAEIRKARESGADLLNLAPGGNQPFCPHDVCVRNAKDNARKIHDDPVRREIWELKQRLGVLLRHGFVREETKAKMRAAAIKRPDLFGLWASI